jgi:hypothetical protein
MDLSGWLLSMTEPIVKRVAAALGFGFVTYAGIETSLNQLLASAKSAWGGVGSTVGQLVALAGINTAIAIIAGALLARLAFVQLKKFMPI